MPNIHVCSLAKLNVTVAESSASHVLTLIKNRDLVKTPPGIAPDRHLILDLADIAAPREGEVAPSEEHVGQLIDFVSGWNADFPLVIHCYAGVSRSTAAAFTAMCHLMPHIPEAEHARLIRKLSPTATPNPLIVSLADRMLSRNGRMVEACDAIGRGADCTEGTPFSVPLQKQEERNRPKSE